MTLPAGSLNKRVVLQSPVHARDAVTGADETTWQTVDTVWAAIAPISVRDFIAADQRQSAVSARITIRYRTDIDATWRVQHGARYYRIIGVFGDTDSGVEYLTLACGEGINEGWA